LIELMIVVAMVAILSSIAYPSYKEYIRRGYRAEARAALLQAQQWLERAATAQGVYPDKLPEALSSQHYRIKVESEKKGMDFKLTAERKGDGAMADDKCGDFTLTHTGTQGIDKNATGTSAADCWRK